jgi:GntR family transcriptional regulator
MAGQGTLCGVVEPSRARVIEWSRQPGSFRVPRQRYEDVAADIRARIESGEYPRGSRLPSRKQLGQVYGASDTVLDKAFMLLRAEGLVETLAGVGVYVRP